MAWSLVSREHTVPNLPPDSDTVWPVIRPHRRRLNAGKDGLFALGQGVSHGRHVSGKVIPAEISLERVTRYLEILKSLNLLPDGLRHLCGFPRIQTSPAHIQGGLSQGASQAFKHFCC